MQEFQSMTLEEGRQMVKSSTILLLSNWDIADALVFNFVSDRLSIEDQNKKEIKGAKFGEEQARLVIWSIRKGSKTSSS